jgi:flagellar biogenesis protein FliO
MQAFFLIQWPTVESNLFLVILLLLAVEWVLLRAMNRDT